MAGPDSAPQSTTNGSTYTVNGGTKTIDKKHPELNVELGIGPIFPGSLWSDWHDQGGTVLNRPTVSIDQLVEMRRRDGQAKALIQLCTLPLRLALQAGEWVAPEDGKAGKEVEFANHMFKLPISGGGMSVPMSKVVRQMLLALTDGFSAFEIVRQVPKDGPLKGKITLRKLAYRDPRTIKMRVDKTGGYNGFRQIAQMTNGEVVDVTLEPLKTFVVTQHDELNPHYGVSLFESAYPHFDAKRKLYYIAHLAAQFAAVPGRVGELPPGAKVSEVLAFRQALTNFAFNAAMVHPPGYKVTPFNGNSQFDFLKLIEHHNLQMSKSVLAAFFDNDQRTVLIESQGQDASADLFLTCMESIANDISEALTQYLMPQFIDYNFTSKKYPIFVPGKLSDSAKEMVKETFKAVVVSSILNCTPEMVREMEKKMSEEMGLDIDYDEIARKEKEAADLKAQQDQAAAQQQADAAAQGLMQPPPGAPPGAPDATAGAPGAPPGAPGDQTAGPLPPSAGGAPPFPPKKKGALALSADIDDLVEAAQALFMGRPDDTSDELPVDAGI